MGHDLLISVLDAQSANATFSGSVLRAAANQVTALAVQPGVRFMAFDAAGERILGAAIAVHGDLPLFDYTSPFPSRGTCVLVGGFLAGPVGLADAAAAIRAVGARRVEAVVVDGPMGSVPGVGRIHRTGRQGSEVA